MCKDDLYGQEQVKTSATATAFKGVQRNRCQCKQTEEQCLDFVRKHTDISMISYNNSKYVCSYLCNEEPHLNNEFPRQIQATVTAASTTHLAHSYFVFFSLFLSIYNEDMNERFMVVLHPRIL